MVLDTLKANGVTTVRLASWACSNPTDRLSTHGHEPSATRVLQMITDREMKPMVMIWLTPAGSLEKERRPSTSGTSNAELQKWETFTEQVVAGRFRRLPHGRWNEPNHDDFMRGADATVYAKILAAANRGISHETHSRQSSSAPQFVDVPWIKKALQAGAQGTTDVMGVHPYMAVGDASPDLPDNGTIWRLRHIPDAARGNARGRRRQADVVHGIRLAHRLYRQCKLATGSGSGDSGRLSRTDSESSQRNGTMSSVCGIPRVGRQQPATLRAMD